MYSEDLVVRGLWTVHTKKGSQSSTVGAVRSRDRVGLPSDDTSWSTCCPNKKPGLAARPHDWRVREGRSIGDVIAAASEMWRNKQTNKLNTFNFLPDGWLTACQVCGVRTIWWLIGRHGGSWWWLVLDFNLYVRVPPLFFLSFFFGPLIWELTILYTTTTVHGRSSCSLYL